MTFNMKLAKVYAQITWIIVSLQCRHLHGSPQTVAGIAPSCNLASLIDLLLIPKNKELRCYPELFLDGGGEGSRTTYLYD